MAKLNVNPTRMELRRLKTRLKTATRGHKLLKDKSDEMIRQFMLYVRENKRLREEVEGELQASLKSFMLARAVSSDAVIEEAVLMPSTHVGLNTSSKNVMSVDVPVFDIVGKPQKYTMPEGVEYRKKALEQAEHKKESTKLTRKMKEIMDNFPEDHPNIEPDEVKKTLKCLD